MFWRKTRAAIGRFHPLHQRLTYDRTLSAAMPPAAWAEVLTSLAGHSAVVKRRKWLLPDRVGHVLVPLIHFLVEDGAPNGSLGVTVDLRGPNLAEKTGPAGYGSVRSAIEWYGVDPWLRIRAQLRDGSVLDLSVTDRYRNRRITKTNPRGKWKRKTKTKGVQRIAVRRTLPRGAVPQRPARPPVRWIAVRVRDGERVDLRATAKLPSIPPPPDQLDQILTVATEVFRWTPPGSGATRRRTA